MKKALFLMMCLCFSISVLAQAKTVTGTVVDAAQFENLGELVKNTIFVA